MTRIDTNDRDPVEVLAAEFLEQQRCGGNPTIAEFAANHPELALEIRELFPAIIAMERLKTHCEDPHVSRASLGAAKLERLGEFRLLAEIGRGGMGIVYEALHESLGRHVAVKVLPRQSAKQYRAFQREARTAARLHHSNIVPLFGVGEHDGYHYIVMQRIQGVDLEAVLKVLKSLFVEGATETSDGASDQTAAPTRYVQDAIQLAQSLVADPGEISTESDSPQAFTPGPKCWQKPKYWQRIVLIGRQSADALHYAHTHRTLHRDIKPANLLLDDQGVVWITDFGLAKAMDDTHGSHCGNLAGTLRFMAPEQFSDRCDHRSDIYSLGLTLYELLSLQPAFSDASRSHLIRKITQESPRPLRKLCPGIPKDLEAIVMKAIARDPDERYPSAEDLAGDLQRFLDDRPVSARPMSLAERFWRWNRRNRAVAILSATAGVFLLTTAVFACAQYIQRARALEIESKLHTQANTERMRAEANLHLAAEAFEGVFGRVTGAPLSGSLPAEPEESPPSTGNRLIVGEHEAAILEGLLAFYDQFATQNEGDLRWQRETARAFRRAGEIQFRLGNSQDAETSFGRALTIYVKLANNEPANAEYVIGVAATRNLLASVAAEMGNRELALDESRGAWRFLLGHPDVLNASVACRIELARAYNRFAISSPQFFFSNRSSSPSKSRSMDSREYLQRSIEIANGLLQDNPGNLEYSLTLAESYRNLWRLESLRKRPAEAQSARDKCIELLEELAATYPAEPDCQVMLVEVYLLPFRYGGAEAANSDAERQADRAVKVASELSQRFPQVPRHQVALAQSLWVAARTRMQAGAEPAARTFLDEAISLQKSIVLRFPSRSRSRQELVRFLEDSARLLRVSGRPKELQLAMEDLIAAMENSPDSFLLFPPTLRSRAKAYAELAEVLHDQGEHERAKAAESKSKELSNEATRRSRPGFWPQSSPSMRSS